MRKKTIFFPVESYDYGGVTSFVSQYVEVLSNHGYKTIILGRLGEIPNPQKMFPNSKVCIVDDKVRKGIVSQVMGLFRYRKSLTRLYSNDNIDIIHFSIALPALFCFTKFNTWKATKVYTFYGAADLEVESGLKDKSKIMNRWGLGLRKKLQYYTLSKSKRIITFSEYSKELLLKHYSKKFNKEITIIPGFVNYK